jgi:hypothetical protein
MPGPTPRRDFLARIAAAAAAAPLAAAASACAHGPASAAASAAAATGRGAGGGSGRGGSPGSGAGAAATAPGGAGGPAAGAGAPRAAAPVFDDSWTRRVVAARHKAVFDAPEVRDGAALFQAAIYREGYRAALGAEPTDVVPVLVLRHTATVLTLDDAIWARYPVARLFKVRPPEARKKDPWPTHNPFSRPHAESERQYEQYFLAALLASGVVVLGCHNAFQGITYRLAKEVGADVAAVRAEARAGMVPGALLQPSGIYATLRAQEVGCTFMRS